jgi:hypothetical protein
MGFFIKEKKSNLCLFKVWGPGLFRLWMIHQRGKLKGAEGQPPVWKRRNTGGSWRCSFHLRPVKIPVKNWGTLTPLWGTLGSRYSISELPWLAKRNHVPSFKFPWTPCYGASVSATSQIQYEFPSRKELERLNCTSCWGQRRNKRKSQKILAKMYYRLQAMKEWLCASW